LTLKAQALASKQYTSIIRLFLHSDVATNGEAINMPRIKKQLAAEFDFAKEGFITVDGYNYSKNDVLEELSREDFLERLHYHKKIWENKAVLSILEDNELRLYELRDQIKTFTNDTAFDAFFSPYFAVPFNYISRNYLNEKRLSDMGAWLLFEDFLQGEDREEAFRAIRIFLDENIRLIKNINSDNYKSIRPQIDHWLKPGGSDLLNHLPHEFYSTKNDLVLYLINLTVRIQKINKQDCKNVSTELTCVTDITKEYEDLIMNNHKVYTQTNYATSSGNNYWWILWVVILLFRLLAGGC